MALLVNPHIPQLSLHVALKQGDPGNAKAPKLKGYVMVTAAQARQLLEICESNVGEQVTFLSIALWQSKKPGSKYPLDGNIKLSVYDPSVEVTQPAQDTAKQETSVWY